MLLIGLTGKAGAGKDTVASMLLEECTGTQVAFADPLRAAAKSIFGLTDEQMNDRLLKEREIPYWGRSPREILQLLGTEALRGTFGPDVWVKRAALRLASLIELERSQPFSSELLIFTDCRFAEEAQWIREQGGVVIEVMCTGLPSAGVAGHASESGLPDALVDLMVINSRQIGLDGLRHVVRQVLEHDIRPLLQQPQRLIA